MKTFITAVSAGLIFFFSAACSKSGSSPAPTPPTPPPPTPQFTISNLVYEPKDIPVKLYIPNFTVSGTLNFTNAQNGISKIRLTSVGGGLDLTVDVQGSSGSSGTITGFFEFTRPAGAADLPFEIWAIDGKGNSSNRLSGTLRIFIDESAVNWWTVEISAPSIMNDVGWFDDDYLAVGNAGAVLQSDMGNEWTRFSTGLNNRLVAIAWSGSRYVAVGDNFSILSSTDGSQWTIHSAEATNTSPLTDVVSFDSAFVAVGGNGAERSGVIMNSPDGCDWTRNPYRSVNGELSAIAASKTRLVVVGTHHNLPIALSSSDGKNWTETALPAPATSLMYDIIWANNQFLVAGYGFLAQSPDGISWTISPIPNNLYLRRIIHTGRKYVAAGSGIYTSADGLNWSRTYAGDPYYPFSSIAWSGSNFVATGMLYRMAVSP